MAKNHQDEAKAQEIGRRIEQARLEAGGMTQVELADLIGVTDRSVQAYEHGDVIPYRKLKDLAEAVGRDPAWILHGVETGKDPEMAEVRMLLIEMNGKLVLLDEKLDRLLGDQDRPF